MLVRATYYYYYYVVGNRMIILKEMFVTMFCYFKGEKGAF